MAPAPSCSHVVQRIESKVKHNLTIRAAAQHARGAPRMAGCTLNPCSAGLYAESRGVWAPASISAAAWQRLQEPTGLHL